MPYDFISQICKSPHLFYHLLVLSKLDFQLLVALINYPSISYPFVGCDIWLELWLMGLVLLFGGFYGIIWPFLFGFILRYDSTMSRSKEISHG